MTPEAAQQALYWLAENMRLWTPAVVLALAGAVVGLGHLVAAAVGER